MKLKTLLNHHYFAIASDAYREKHFNAAFIQVPTTNCWPLILLFAAFIMAGWTF